MLLTTSCTHALEMAAVLTQVKPGDEVILPSYTFVSTADAFVQRGAPLVFVDIRPDTMNLDERLIEDAITDKTKVIVPVHFAGVGCAMDEIMEIAARHHLMVVEDAAQGIYAYYKGRALGTIGDFGCYSFHETKNYSMGEGGALVFQNNDFLERAEIIREKGTDRSKFFRGQVDKYRKDRLDSWNYYNEELRPLAEAGYIEQPFIPDYADHNAHMYYIKTKDLETRGRLIDFMRKHDILTVFHYVPLHSAPAGKKFGRFHGEDKYTTKESERLVRLPMYYHLKEEDREQVVKAIKEFYE